MADETIRVGDVCVDLAQSQPWQDEEALRALYIEHGMKMAEISDLLGCAKSTVVRWCDLHGIETRSSNDYRGEQPWQDGSVLRELYDDKGMKQREMADELGCCIATIEKWCSRFGVGGRTVSDYAARRPASFFTERAGYERVADNHTHVRIHRLLAVAEFGLDALRGMAVHHRNGVRWDNRPENIELLSNSEHMKLHSESRTRDEEGNYA